MRQQAEAMSYSHASRIRSAPSTDGTETPHVLATAAGGGVARLYSCGNPTKPLGRASPSPIWPKNWRWRRPTFRLREFAVLHILTLWQLNRLFGATYGGRTALSHGCGNPRYFLDWRRGNSPPNWGDNSRRRYPAISRWRYASFPRLAVG